MELADERRQRLARTIAAGRLYSADLSCEAELRAFAREEGVLPLLDWIAGGLPAVRAHAAVQLARQARVTRVLDLLAADGVAAVVFKGAHLAYACYPDPCLRPHVDTDLLIDPADVEKARRVFERAGHRAIPHVSGRFVMSQCHYVDGEVGGAYAYDVHWQIANPAVFRDLLPFESVRARAVPLPAYGPHGLGPSLPHALLIACIHRAAHHDASDRLIWMTDVRLLLRAATPADVSEFCRLADALGLTAVCYDACARASHLFGDVRIPAGLQKGAAGMHEPSRAYLDAPSPMRRLWLDLVALGTWRRRATLLREHLLPPRAYMRAMPGAHGPLPLAYATRIVRGVFEWKRR